MHMKMQFSSNYQADRRVLREQLEHMEALTQHALPSKVYFKWAQ